MSGRDLLRELEVLVRSRYSLVVLETAEEERAALLLRELAHRMGLPLFTWSMTRGIRRDDGGSVHAPRGAGPSAPERDPFVPDPFSRSGRIPMAAFERRDEPAGTPYDTTHPVQALHHVELAGLAAVYHFSGLGAHLDEPLVAAKLRDAAASFREGSGAIVLTGAGARLPDSVRSMGGVLALPLPTAAEYRKMLRETVEEMVGRDRVKVEMTAADVTRLLGALRGMGLEEARRVLTRVMLEDGRLAPDDLPRVLRSKAEAIAREGLLEYVPVEDTMEGVAGLAGLKDWLARRRALVADPAKAAEYGLPFPRGILLLGVPGCGKSLSARAVAADWGLPLLRLDPAALYDRYLGESEKNFARALGTAERLAPSVLWIDEVEKAFAAGGGEDGGSSSRVLGGFLSWMQDRKADVFVVATANDVSRLPPEMLRKGRFDEVFFVDLPDAEARAALFALHLRRRRLDPARFDVRALASAAEGFSGAEVEQAIVSSVYSALAAGEAPSSAALAAELGRTRPLSVTRAEEIARLRDWARERTVSAG